MYINFTNKKNKNSIYFIINWKSKIKNTKIQKYIENFKFDKWKNFEIKTLNEINNNNNKQISNTYIFVKNHKALEENIEEIIINLWNIIRKTNDKFNMSFKRLWIDKKIQENFIELLAQKLYNFNMFKSENNIKYSINIDTNIDTSKMIKKLEILYWVRDLQNMPANSLNPETYESIIKKVFWKNKKVKIKIIKWKELEKIWANWIYSVWKWSQYDPRIIILEYKNTEKNNFDWLIWKWITFDSWWYNIKPTWYMEDMHLDMWGSAVSLWIFRYLVETWYKWNLVCWVWIAENLVSDKSYSPTDIIKMYNWKTVQITNTDAEWRLVLADTISYVEKNYNINKLFDFATLTWAALIALWWDITSILWNNKKLIKEIIKNWEDMKENLWELPLYKKYKSKLKSPFADIYNCAKWREAWTITAALFLSYFIKSKNWVHFDIAWPEIKENDPLYGTWWTAIQYRNIVNFFENK